MGSASEGNIELRPVNPADMDTLFAQMRDPESVWMAAFTTENPNDRAEFDAQMAGLISAPETTVRTIVCNARLVGSITSGPMEGQPHVAYWIDRAVWGRGIASRALALFLDAYGKRPLYARAASDNAASLRVLEKSGFEIVGTETSYAPGRGMEIEERILRLT